jgi:hypothetical protein
MELLLAAKALGRGLSTTTVPSRDKAIKIDVINGRRRSMCIVKNLLIFIKHDDMPGNYLRSQGTSLLLQQVAIAGLIDISIFEQV